MDSGGRRFEGLKRRVMRRNPQTISREGDGSFKFAEGRGKSR